MSVSPTGFYKMLNADLSAPMGVGSYVIGKPMPPVEGPLVLCKNGYHVVRLEHLAEFLSYGPSIHPVLEVGNEIIDDGDKQIVRTITIGPAYTTWTRNAIVQFAADCAEHVLHIFEQRYPDDARPRAAIEAARSGNATAGAAYAAAYAADAARAAANAAANATDAAYYAANAAAVAAYYAAYAADAARATDYAAAYAAAHGADRAAAGAERKWQESRLRYYLFSQD